MKPFLTASLMAAPVAALLSTAAAADHTHPSDARFAPPPELAASMSAPANLSYRQIMAALDDEGYAVTEVRRTLLGRIHIDALSARYIRELVISRSTGEIKLDAIQPRPGIPAEAAAAAAYRATGAAAAAGSVVVLPSASGASTGTGRQTGDMPAGLGGLAGSGNPGLSGGLDLDVTVETDGGLGGAVSGALGGLGLGN